MVKDRLGEHRKAYFVGECNRHHPIKVVNVLAKCMNIVFRERPDVVISTGAAAGCVSCFLGKGLGAKVIWVDSIANVERVSLSGRMVRHIADLFLVQWPDLADRYKNAEFVGSVL
jgi:UDP-N-acetylglucosamine:LPS N-acetylglucosamine transferase